MFCDELALNLGFQLTRTWFQTGDVEGYKKKFYDLHALERKNRWKPNYILPGTRLRNPLMGNEGVITEDFRLTKHADQVEKACRHQWQVERGWTSGDGGPKVADDS